MITNKTKHFTRTSTYITFHTKYSVLQLQVILSEHKQIWAAENCTLFLNYITK